MAWKKYTICGHDRIEYCEKSFRIVVGGEFSNVIFNGDPMTENKLKDLSQAVEFGIELGMKAGRNSLRQDIKDLLKEV